MVLAPSHALSERDVSKGLRLVIVEGLTTEVMTSLTGGAFLTAMALLMGANNSQIGLLAALPSLTNFFQLLSIFLVHKFNNRRAIAVICSVLARVPLIVIGALALFSEGNASVKFLIYFLFFYYMFGSIAGPSWNAWMKDLVPQQSLGSYFAKRSSYMQLLNVVVSLLLALAVDYVKNSYKELELTTYGIMFVISGLVGLIGAAVLSRVPEPLAEQPEGNMFRIFKYPLKDKNFRRLLQFNSGWSFALNIATPFFTVFMLKTLNLSLSYIIALTILSQVASLLTIRMWGTSADKYSNKTIIAIAGPLYILCIIAWCFVGMYSYFFANLLLLVVIHIFTGISTAGINLAVTNIGLKLSPRQHAVVYLSTKNIITSAFASLAPLIGGPLADFFMNRSLEINIEWMGPEVQKVIHIISLQGFNFLFLIGALLALIALELLVHVNEVGEVEKELVVRVMRTNIRSSVKDFFLIDTLVSWHNHVWEIIRRRLPWKKEDRATPGDG
jgi:MFS family permease